MIVDIKTMEIQRQKVDYIMHFTNPMWLFCRIYKVIGKDCTKWLIFGWYERLWCYYFRKEA